jgi:hypothetical protein
VIGTVKPPRSTTAKPQDSEHRIDL